MKRRISNVRRKSTYEKQTSIQGRIRDGLSQLWRFDLKSLISSKSTNKQQSNSPITDITVSAAIVCLFHLERNMRWAGLELSSRHYCWTDMKNRDSASVSEAVAFQLRNSLATYVQDNVFTLTDPSPNKILQLFQQFQTLDPSNRCLFIFNGHGTPEPVTEDSLILPPDEGFDKSELPISTLVNSLPIPGCFIFDADFSGGLFKTFSEAANGRDQIAFFSCGPNECLPHRIGLPSDLFTSCLLTPAYISMLWGSRQFYAFDSGGLHQFQLNQFSDENRVHPHLLLFSYEIERLLQCLVKAMAYSSLTPNNLFDLFYRDQKVGKLYVNFCVAQRIGSEIGFTPMSYPEIPDFSRHHLWDFFDLYLDTVLFRLTEIESSKSIGQQQISEDMTFFLSNALTTIENSLEMNFLEAEVPEISLLPLILLDTNLIERSIISFTKFIDTGVKALRTSLCFGILPILLSIQSQNNVNLLIPISYCFAKLIAFAYNNSNENLIPFTCSGSKLINLLLMNTNNSICLVLALIILITDIKLDPIEEMSTISTNMFSLILKQITNNSLVVKFWILMFVSNYLIYASKENQQIQQIPIEKVVLSTGKSSSCEIRAAFLSALTSIIDYKDNIFQSFGSLFLKILDFYLNEPSHIVRIHLLILLKHSLNNTSITTEIKNKVLIMLKLLENDPHPEIYLKATESTSESFDVVTTLLKGSFDAFIESEYPKISEYTSPPFSMPLKEESISFIDIFIDTSNSNFKFSEIDYFDYNLPITSNIAFFGTEKLVVGDSDGNLIIRDYSNHTNELVHNSSKLFSLVSCKHTIHKIIPINEASLISTRKGDISIVSNLLSVTPIIADCFQLKTENLLPTNNLPTLELYHNILYASIEPNIIQRWNAELCYYDTPIKIKSDNSYNINVIRSVQSKDNIIGIGSKDLKFIDIRDLNNISIVSCIKKEPIDFKSCSQNQFIITFKDGSLSMIDIRMPSQENLLVNNMNANTVDTCMWAPITLCSNGNNLAIIDINSKKQFSVLDALYTQKRNQIKINVSALNQMTPALGFVANGTSFHIVGIVS